MSKIHDKLKKHVLVDGFAHVADLQKSHGSWFVDKITGKEYLDCYSLHASQPLGWNYSKLEQYKDLITEIAFHNITNSDLYTEQYAEFVEEFAKTTPDFKYRFFISGGTLGVENALKAAFDWKAQLLGYDESYTDEKYVNNLDIIHFNSAFHGRSGYTLSLTNTGFLKTKLYPKFNWTRVTAPGYWGGTGAWEQNIQEECERQTCNAIERCMKRGMVAAFIMETIQGEGGDIHFRKEFFHKIRKLCDEHQAMFILDEVQTGLGLTGKMWAYQHFDVIPDLMSFGKKTQVCGCASTDRIDSVIDNVFRTSGRINSTWGGNLIDMVRATIYFRIIEEDNLVENARVVGDYFLNQLKQLPLINVRGRGLMIAFDLPHKKGICGNDWLKKLNEKVFCLKSGQVSIRFRPHLTFSKEDADYAVKSIKDIL